MDIDHRGETPEPGPDPTRCPTCRTPFPRPLDLRFGYCWECHDFTGEPTSIVFHGDEAFGERVRDKVLHMEPSPIRMMTDEEREEMMKRNRDALRAEAYVGLTIGDSPGARLLGGEAAVRHLMREHVEKYPPSWRERIRWRLRDVGDWLRGLSARR